MRFYTEFILASRSPRRQRLLARLGVPFRVQVSPIDEVIPDGLAPREVVTLLAREKAASVAALHPSALTLAADTLVVLDDDILGKPADAAEAGAMLRRLSGRTHTVYTGLALLHPASGRQVTAWEATDVTFGRLHDEEIDAYVASGAPMDKAGAYGIQEDFGAVFVTRIEGDFYTVMGLPLHRLYRLLRDHFADLFSL